MNKRLFLLVLDSLGIGELPDAADYGDKGSNTLASICRSEQLAAPCLRGLGLYNIDGVTCAQPVEQPGACFARLAEQSRGKDTTTGHWEIAGVISPEAMPTYPDGFPPEIIGQLEQRSGRRILCNKPYSGTRVIEDYGARQMESGALIVYTSADSVLQIAAHEEVIPLEELYRICAAAREIMQGEHGVGRIIARPFAGRPGSFARTRNRHDYSLPPPADTMCDLLAAKGLEVIGVGKIGDIFAGRGITGSYATRSNTDGMERTIALAKEGFNGLCFVNLVDFDMLYGHRNDVDGYAAALTEFDRQLVTLLAMLGSNDAVIITADHGCDPATPSTDHSREYVPMLIAGERLRQGINLGTRGTFADIAATVQDYFGLPVKTSGQSFLPNVT